MYHIGFRLTENDDPEERLEEAALWKAMKDHYGDRISPVTARRPAEDDWIMFGRSERFETGQEPVSSLLEYWRDPAFLKHCGRDFGLVSIEGLRDAVSALHAQGVGAFVKSTRSKHFICRVPTGADVDDEMGAMAYSFIDGPKLMVQALADVRDEYRFFVIDRRIVTFSPVMVSLTPLDWRENINAVYETPTNSRKRSDVDQVARYYELVEEVAAEMVPDHAVVDVALFDGSPAVVEMNPMRLGQIGLYACDVKALAVASEKLFDGFIPQRRPPFVADEDEEEFEDGFDPPSSNGL
jgi:hypothetical protein